MNTTTLIPAKAVWRYLDNGSEPGTAWRAPGFDDSGWASGPAQLGYGEGDEATKVSFGPNPRQKYLTTYFRHRFTVADRSRFKNLVARMIADDGSVIYLNGVEVDRENLPAGNVSSSTRALKYSVEGLYLIRNIDPKQLVDGTNVLAVEVHQHAGDSSDLSFSLALTASEDLVLTRGPYLQGGAPTRATVRWRTDLPADSRVRYGTSAANLSGVADDPALTTEHAVTLTNLTPGTLHYYSIGTVAGAFAGGGTAAHSFVTPPPPGTNKPTRVWVIGDAGLANEEAARVRDAYERFTGARETDLWLMLGDNAYNEGTDDQHQKAVFEMYPAMLPRVFLWPTIGNHETYGSIAKEPEVYLEIFNLPTGGEAGGVPSGTEKYYSFDHGNIHFVCLDSMSSARRSDPMLGTPPMLTWLESDLAANDKTWLVAFWHHPPYSRGSHDSDWERELVEMRENVVPLLEKHGVDLVLTGHSHTYERSFLIDGHHGVAETLNPAMIKNAGAGREGEGGSYTTLAARAGAGAGAAPEGAVYVVAGSAAQVSAGFPLDHPAMFVSLEQLGSLVLDVNGQRLDAVFLRDTGEIGDRFTIEKGVPPPSAPPEAPAMLTATASSSTVARLTWADHASTESGFELERSPDGAPATFAVVQLLGANAVRHDDGRLTPSMGYQYRVRAVNGAGPSAWSNLATVRTPRECDPPELCGGPDGGVDGGEPGAVGSGAEGGRRPPRRSGCAVGAGAGGAAPASAAVPLAVLTWSLARRRRERTRVLPASATRRAAA